MISPLDFDPLDVLERHVRALDLNAPPAISDDELIELILGEQFVPSTVVPLRWPRRRRRWIIGAGIVVVASGGVAVAALTGGKQPTNHSTGAACASSFDLQASQFSLVPGADPLQGCAQLWEKGVLPEKANDNAVATGPVPTLLGCITPAGIVEVFPITTQSCAQLGLVDADLTPEKPVPPALVTVPELNNRLVDAINVHCLSQDAAESAARAVLDTAGYKSWTITRDPRPAQCFTMVVVEEKSLVQLVSSPDTQQSTQTTGD